MPKIRFGSTEPDHAPESDTEDTVPYTRDEGTDSDGSDDNAPPEAFTLQDGKQSVEVHDVALHDFQLESTRRRKEANRARDAAMKEAASTRTSNKRKPKVQNAESDCDTSDDADGNDDQWGGIAEDSGSSQSDSDVNNSHVVEDVHAQAIRLPSHLPDSLFMEAAASEKMQSTSTTSKLVKNGKKRRLKKSKSSGTRSERVVGSRTIRTVPESSQLALTQANKGARVILQKRPKAKTGRWERRHAHLVMSNGRSGPARNFARSNQ